jgi:hypothetical protein
MRLGCVVALAGGSDDDAELIRGHLRAARM